MCKPTSHRTILHWCDRSCINSQGALLTAPCVSEPVYHVCVATLTTYVAEQISSAYALLLHRTASSSSRFDQQCHVDIEGSMFIYKNLRAHNVIYELFSAMQSTHGIYQLEERKCPAKFTGLPADGQQSLWPVQPSGPATVRFNVPGTVRIS